MKQTVLTTAVAGLLLIGGSVAARAEVPGSASNLSPSPTTTASTPYRMTKLVSLHLNRNCISQGQQRFRARIVTAGTGSPTFLRGYWILSAGKDGHGAEFSIPRAESTDASGLTTWVWTWDGAAEVETDHTIKFTIRDADLRIQFHRGVSFKKHISVLPATRHCS